MDPSVITNYDWRIGATADVFEITRNEQVKMQVFGESNVIAKPIYIASNVVLTNEPVADGLETRSNAWNTGAAQAAGLDSVSGAWSKAVSDFGTVSGHVDLIQSAQTEISNKADTAYAVSAGLNTRSSAWDTVSATVADRSNDWDAAAAGGSVSGWSGLEATQQVYWLSTTTTSNILIPPGTGDFYYAVGGVYTQIDNVLGNPAYHSTNGYYLFYGTNDFYMVGGKEVYRLHNSLADEGSEYYQPSAYPVGTFTYGDFIAEGTLPVSEWMDPSVITNYDWRIGATADVFEITRNEQVKMQVFGESNQFAKAIYINGNAVLTNEPVADGLNTRSNTWDTAAAQATGLDSKSNTWTGTETTATSAYLIAVGLESQSNAWHITSTSLFGGADTTGAVTSAAGDAGNFLKADGTWATPAGAGDFKADGSVPMTGTLLTTNITISGGSPTNGAVYIATNSAGEGMWSGWAVFRARLAVVQTNYQDTVSNMYYGTEDYDYGNNFDGTTFTTPVRGIYLFSSKGIWRRALGTADGHQLFMYIGGSLSYFDDGSYSTTLRGGSCRITEIRFVEAGTAVMCKGGGVPGFTNYWRDDYTSFEGVLLREVP
jgi:hypothetical protein